MRVIGAIERVPPPSVDEFAERFVGPERPVVLAGAIDQWEARSRWTAAGLRARLQGVTTSFKVSPSHRHPDFRATSLAETFAVEAGTFDELFDRVTGSQAARYLLTGSEEFLLRRAETGELERNPKLARLLDDIEIPPFVPLERLRSSWFWISGAGVRTWLHYDNNGCHNLNAQVSGAKRVLLFEPDQLPRLYPFEFGGENPAYNCCRVDVESPDLDAFPEFGGVECWSGEVEAGDLLFVPANWIHTFAHVGDWNVNVNFWWCPRRPRETVVSIRQAILDEAAARGELTEPEREEFARRERLALGARAGR
ncbi:MAG: cupin-like domain-containing protein [Planctomycetes bacterium]|nr:cupin-like domain-containing protein [Planctomycetota bacterium]